MAVFHVGFTPISRGEKAKNGKPATYDTRSAVACAAYRAGEKLRDDRYGKTQNYANRKGVVHTEIILPEGANPKLADRGYLWNKVEQLEKRKDAQLSREVNISLPHELDDKARKKLLLDYVKKEFVSRGMIADIAIHKPVKEKGDHPLNHHAHVMLTLRKVEKEGFNSLKTREWNSHKNVTHWRKQWEIQTNRTLEANNIKARISCETLVKQRDIALKRGDKDKAAELDRKPEIYVGVKAQKIERKRNQTGYTKKEFPYNPPAPTHENHHTNPRKKHRSTWNRDYSKYTKSRAMHNASIIRENSKKYEKHYTKIAVQKVRLQQHLLRYSSAKYKNNPHFKKRLGLVKSLLERIIRSSIKSTKVLNKRNSRYRDYKTRFLMPSRNMKRKRSKSLFLGWEMER